MENDSRTCIEAYLCAHADKEKEKTAVISGEDEVSYGKLWEMVRGFARYLIEDCHVRKGDRVLVRASQSVSYAVTYFAVHLSGAVFVPLEKGMDEEDCQKIRTETESVVYISNPPGDFTDVKDIRAKQVEEIAGQWFREEYDFAFPGADDLADIMYTTGTTGRAKGVMVTHGALVATAENYEHGFEIKKSDVMAVPGPLNHVNALRKLYLAIKNGSTIVILNGLLSMKALFHALDSKGVTSLCLPPASLRTIWHFTGDKLADYAGQIDFVECSTAPLSEEDKETLRRELPSSRLYNNYGLSECGAMVMYDFNRYPEKGQGCVGKPMPHSHVILVDENRKEICASKEHPGLIANRGPINMAGYWHMSELTAQVMADGYVYTNDLGYFDEDGFLYIVGRKDDTINIGGLKAQPAQIEEKALQMGMIEECLCVPMPDPVTENALKLYVVMKPGEAFHEDQILEYLTRHLPSYQVPKTVEQVKEIPKNYMGKPDRKAFAKGREGDSKGEENG